MSFITCLYIILGGAIGTFARYAISLWAVPISYEMPWGTIVINILGSLIIGLFGTLTVVQGRYPVSENIRLFVMIGICGGFTTFSAFSLQTLDLIRSGALVRAGLNVITSVVLCIAAVGLGQLIASKLNDRVPQVTDLQLKETEATDMPDAI